MKKGIIAAVAAVVVLVVLLVVVKSNRDVQPGEHTQPRTNAPITIGWIGALTGDAAPYGIAIKRGTDLAVEEINEQGGVAGSPLRVIYEDDQANPTKGVSALQKLLAVNKPPVVIQACASSVMLAAMPIAEQASVVYISPSCSSDKIRDEKIANHMTYIFRTWPSDSRQGELLAEISYKDLHAKRAAILYISTDYGKGLRDIFLKAFRELGGTVVSDESFTEGTSDFRTQLAKLKETNPDVVFLPAHYREAAQVLKQAKELSIAVPFISDAALNSPELLKLAANAAEGLTVTSPQWNVESERPKVRDFVQHFEERFGEKPDIYAAAAYDCAYVIATAMKNGGLTSREIRDALARLDDFDGVTGRIAFDQYGEVQAMYDKLVVSGGEFVSATP